MIKVCGKCCQLLLKLGHCRSIDQGTIGIHWDWVYYNIYSVQICMQLYVLIGHYPGLSTFFQLDVYVHPQIRGCACKIKHLCELIHMLTKGQVNMLKHV